MKKIISVFMCLIILSFFVSNVYAENKNEKKPNYFYFVNGTVGPTGIKSSILGAQVYYPKKRIIGFSTCLYEIYYPWGVFKEDITKECYGINLPIYFHVLL